ncbi:MAG: hypothetical protein HQL96_17415 [Magnetococcales bacterium]|nr:hypothetical protein [Magnetococcales bacterium]
MAMAVVAVFGSGQNPGRRAVFSFLFSRSNRFVVGGHVAIRRRWNATGFFAFFENFLNENGGVCPPKRGRFGAWRVPRGGM